MEQVEKAAAAPTPTAAKSTTSHLQKLRAKHVDDSKKVATDFFGRVVKVLLILGNVSLFLIWMSQLFSG